MLRHLGARREPKNFANRGQMEALPVAAVHDRIKLGHVPRTVAAPPVEMETEWRRAVRHTPHSHNFLRVAYHRHFVNWRWAVSRS